MLRGMNFSEASYYAEKPYYSNIIKQTINDKDLMHFSDATTLLHLNNLLTKLSEYDEKMMQVPKERMRDYFTPKGWARNDYREKALPELYSKIKIAAEQTLEQLTKVGEDYRKGFIKKKYPHLMV